jgi:hypothetical protein
MGVLWIDRLRGSGGAGGRGPEPAGSWNHPSESIGHPPHRSLDRGYDSPMGGVSYDRMSSQHGRARWWRAGRHAVLATALALLAVPGSGHAAVRRTQVVQAAALSTTAEPSADCTIFSGSPTSAAQCGGGPDDLVGSDGNGALHRTMVSFAGGLGIPAGSHILSSTLTINVLGAFGSHRHMGARHDPVIHSGERDLGHV